MQQQLQAGLALPLRQLLLVVPQLVQQRVHIRLAQRILRVWVERRWCRKIEHAWSSTGWAVRLLGENHTSSRDSSSQLAQPHLVVGDGVLQQLQRGWRRAQRAAVRTLGNLWHGCGSEAAHGGWDEAQAAGLKLPGQLAARASCTASQYIAPTDHASGRPNPGNTPCLAEQEVGVCEVGGEEAGAGGAVLLVPQVLIQAAVAEGVACAVLW